MLTGLSHKGYYVKSERRFLKSLEASFRRCEGATVNLNTNGVLWRLTGRCCSWKDLPPISPRELRDAAGMDMKQPIVEQ